jgi:hypothetical protein
MQQTVILTTKRAKVANDSDIDTSNLLIFVLFVLLKLRDISGRGKFGSRQSGKKIFSRQAAKTAK